MADADNISATPFDLPRPELLAFHSLSEEQQEVIEFIMDHGSAKRDLSDFLEWKHLNPGKRYKVGDCHGDGVCPVTGVIGFQNGSACHKP